MENVQLGSFGVFQELADGIKHVIQEIVLTWKHRAFAKQHERVASLEVSYGTCVFFFAVNDFLSAADL